MSALEISQRRELLAFQVAEVKAQVRTLRQRQKALEGELARVDADRDILACGGGVWTYEATDVDGGQVFTGEIIALDQLQAIHRLNTSGTLPKAVGYSVRMQRKEETR